MSEHDEQKALIQWLDFQYPDTLFFAIPNGAHLAGTDRQRFAQINKLKAEGLVPGTPDVFIAEPRGGYAGCFVEMKTLTGKLSDNQKEFLARAEARGFYTIVGFGFEFARDMVDDYLSGKAKR